VSDTVIREWPNDVSNADAMDGPRGWIQWKGTSVCMDVHCACGELTHIDAEYAYAVKCGACGRLWAVGANVRLYAMDEATKNAPEPITSE
jgi:ribosomal protein S27E